MLPRASLVLACGLLLTHPAARQPSSAAAAALRLRVSARRLEAGENAAVWLQPSLPLRGIIRFTLLNAARQPVWKASVPAGAARAGFSLPRPGRYRLQARVGARRLRLALQALPPPPPWYGGVLPVQALGLPDTLRAYLRAHGFAVTRGLHGPRPRLILLARTRWNWSLYLRLWREVARGSNLLLLRPPNPAAAPAWPLAVHLAPWSAAACDADFFTVPRLGLNLAPRARALLARRLRPHHGYDLRRQSVIIPLSLSGRMLAIGRYHAPRLGCRPLFSFRFGRGLVTVTSLPLLRRFANAWVRLYLMNLLKAAARRHPGPHTPGLAWVVRSRLQKLARQPPAPPNRQ